MNAPHLIPLSECKTGQCIQLVKCEVPGVLRRRLLDLGFVPGTIVKVLQKSPLGDPVAYRVSNTTIALRREEANLIFGELKEAE
ncbi:ferrous iron transport protein A [Paenibacillus sp. JMULE4]|uniref:Ferrous iron transport protein A n=1 Tax=Paenibacillus validus TaxID=44253 RepID=A0A7X2ZDV3_9BACL|nr:MULTISPECIES: FeoA family protein [Paenibacillus]MUG73056.1 ferrous iron transport protein A [Paenibacillus validus]NTZ19471.1 ferrous iron transport protein A [Paenibacillus sp. JMULE4]